MVDQHGVWAEELVGRRRTSRDVQVSVYTGVYLERRGAHCGFLLGYVVEMDDSARIDNINYLSVRMIGVITRRSDHRYVRIGDHSPLRRIGRPWLQPRAA